MTLRMNRSRVASVVVASVALTTVVTGAYAASALKDDGAITACYRLKTGDLRLETVKAPCDTEAQKWRLRERRITWNEEGLPGADGLDGADGADGRDGIPGADGQRGSIGPIGPVGLTGPMGLTGLDGKNGLDGLDGENGVDGADGLDGSTVRSGEGVPTAGTGSNGDFYYDTAAHTIYGPKAAGVWSDGTPLIGPQGKQGEQGAQGSTGPTGPVGPAGPGPVQFGTDTGAAADGDGAQCTLGTVSLTAGSVGVGIPARGQLLHISSNEALFSLLGTRHGGDGRTTFALPDLRSAAPNGTTYTICDWGLFPSRR